ncbi:hypothetical protein KL921_000842 [Ogataea angusta]|nr:hypothetical protein KL921_000842 [Ogataea angusta]
MMTEMRGTKPRVVFFGGLNENLPEFKQFTKTFDVVFYELVSREQFVSDLNTKLQNVVAIYGAWAPFGKIGNLDKELVVKLPSSLKLITVCSAGYGGIDLEALRVRGIKFCNSPTFGASAVAETVLYHVLNGFRKFGLFEATLRQNPHTIEARSLLGNVKTFDADRGVFVFDHSNKTKYCFGHHVGTIDVHSPVGKTATVIGFGAIGKEVGARLSSLGMNIIYIKRNRLSPEEEGQLGYRVRYAARIHDVAAESDCIVLCLPATPQSINMINRDVIQLMKKGVVLVNVGRGSLINDKDMIQGLKDGRIGFVGLDVFPEEPLVHHCERQDMSLTPHVGSATSENFDQTAIFCLENITQYLLHGKIENLQN